MPFPDPFDRDDEPSWVEPSAVEYWIIGALVIGGWAYGIYYGVRGLWGA
jgi:hypothetical protein